MDDVLVVSSFVPGQSGPYRSERFEVAEVACEADYDYWRALAAAWDTPRTLVIVEHDMECSDDLIGQIVACKHRKCSWAYLLYWASTHQPPHYAHRNGGPAAGRWVSEGEEWATFGGIGLCKLTSETRVFGLTESHWSLLDTQVSACSVGNWHLHWPAVEHYHQ